MQTDWLSFDSDNAHAGFRLMKLEVFNWGTFHARVHRITPDGCIALLTGANGSGKSTLVDALITLLVPNRHQQRIYNLAAGVQGKRERTERSYVLGAYGSEQQEDSNRARTCYLREAGDFSILLATFRNEGYREEVTLAQVLYLASDKPTPEHEFFVAQRELSIAADFALEGTPEQLRRELQKRGVRWFGKFPAYCAHFRQLMHIGSEKALDLLNQTVSIKEVHDLSEFLREHMIERFDAQEKIAELRKNYDDLNVVYERIKKDRAMLGDLEPITNRADAYRTATRELAQWQLVSGELEGFFAREHTRLLRDGIFATEEKQRLCVERIARLDSELKQANASKVELEVAKRTDAVGRKVSDIEAQIERTTSDRKQRQTNAQDFDRSIKATGIALRVTSEEEFAAAQKTLILRKEETNKNRADLSAEIANLTARKQQREARQNEIEDELRSLYARKDLIPENNRRIRAMLLEAVGADAEDIPFVGELVQVKGDSERWEPAIEKLLRNFGLRLLVPDQEFGRAANAYFHARHIGGRAVYHRVGASPALDLPLPRTPVDSLFHKLEFKREHPLAWWVEREVAAHFNYLCTDDLDRFARAELALTSMGLIKSGRTRHEKDDRYKLGDRQQYVLGWSNERKVEALRDELRQSMIELRSIEETLTGKNRLLKKLDDFLPIFGALGAVTSFQQIDYLTLLRQVEHLEHQKIELEKSSDHLATLTAQIEQAETAITRLTGERDRAIGERDKCEERVKAHNKKIESYAVLILQWKDHDFTVIEEKLRERTPAPLTIDNITGHRDMLRTEAGGEVRRFGKTESDLREKIGQAMTGFRRDHADESEVRDLTEDIQALDDYCTLAQRIENDGLPAHENEFKRLLDRKVVQDIALFQQELHEQVRVIKTNIEEINGSLRTIDYTDATYIKLLPLDTTDQRIATFKAKLRSCCEGSIGEALETNEARFARIKELIDLFQIQPEWTRHVTDVRRWLDFAARENWRSDDTQKQFFDSSSGRSGGQKAKLAFTILASALAYQFGLRPGETRSRSFRFVAVDEMFSKSDPENSRYALELFRQLDLQLLIVCPFDAKALEVEPFVQRYHFSANPDETASEVFNLSVTQWEEKKREMREARHAAA